MKIPHALFRLINIAMVILLRSPLHSILSKSILAIRYRGVRSGRTVTVPVRYHRRGDDIVVMTSEETSWWPNFLQSTEANVLLGGKWSAAQVQATRSNPNLAGPIMREMWAKHPSDSAYMNVKMRSGEPDPDDFDEALQTAVVITIRQRIQAR
jgi:hypothetical protein